MRHDAECVTAGCGTGIAAAGCGTERNGPSALREDLLDLLRQKEVRRKMNEALLREAAGESKSTGVIRAYELALKIIQEAGEDAPPEELDLRRFSDRQLRMMIARLKRGTENGASYRDRESRDTENREAENRKPENGKAENWKAEKRDTGSDTSKFDTAYDTSAKDSGGRHGQPGAS